MLSLWHFTLIVAISLSVTTGEYHYRTELFEVPLDHFSYVNDKTFKIRYLTNDSYAYNDRSSPILFFLGNEADIDWIAQNSGFVWEAAQALNASIVYAEHRYYGKSLPFGDRSLSAPKLSGYLTPEQALADNADLLSTRVNKEQRPVITLGGSYGGALSAWFRMKYPHLTTGAIASSAPILQFTTDCQTFRQLATAVYTDGHANCSRNVKASWPIIKEMSATPQGRDALNAKFEFCRNLTKPEDQDQFVDYLVDVYSVLAQNNFPYETAGHTPLPANPVNAFCSYLNRSYEGEELIDALHGAVSVYSNYSGEAQCIDFSNAAGPTTNRFKGAFSFELCTELAFPFCSRADDPKTMFPEDEWNMTEYSNRCYDSFGVRPNTQTVLTNFGEDRLKYVTNILFSYGLIDPWRGGGIKHSPNDQIEILEIENSAHTFDLRGSNPNDPESVRVARRKQIDVMRQWLAGIGTDYY